MPMAHFLHSLGEILWAERIVLLTAVALHITATVQLALRNKQRSAGRLLAQGGDQLLLRLKDDVLVGPHRAGLHHLSPAAPDRRLSSIRAQPSLRAMFTTMWSPASRSGGFRLWYIFAICLLGLHLRHGLWSMFQSVGLSHPRYTPMLKNAAMLDRDR